MIAFTKLQKIHLETKLMIDRSKLPGIFISCCLYYIDKGSVLVRENGKRKGQDGPKKGDI